jgi:hypothetical protein
MKDWAHLLYGVARASSRSCVASNKRLAKRSKLRRVRLCTINRERVWRGESVGFRGPADYFAITTGSRSTATCWLLR